MAFPLKLRKVDKSEIERRVTEALQMVRLSGYEKRSIQKLLVDNGSVSQSRVPLSINHVLSCWMNPYLP